MRWLAMCGVIVGTAACSASRPDSSPPPPATELQQPAATASGAASTLPAAESLATASDAARIHAVLVVGKRVFVLPTSDATRRPKGSPGKPELVVVGHAITAPFWILEPEPSAGPAFTFVSAAGACVDRAEQRWLIGQGTPDAASAADATTWLDAVELRGCALKTAPAAGGVFWDHFAIEGEHPEARMLPTKWLEGDAARGVTQWLERYVADAGNPYRALEERIAETSVMYFDGYEDVRFLKTHAENGVGRGISWLLRIVTGDQLIATLRNTTPDAAVVLGERLFVLASIETPQSGKVEQRLLELRGGRVLDAGTLKMPPAPAADR